MLMDFGLKQKTDYFSVSTVIDNTVSIMRQKEREIERQKNK